MTTFTQIRQQIISLEKQTETRLGLYSTYAQSTSSSALSEELKLNKEITELLSKRDSLNSQLVNVLDSSNSGGGGPGDSGKGGSTSKLQQINRIKEKFNENKRDFDRIKRAIDQERDRLNLLYNVKTYIEDHQRRTEQDVGTGSGTSEEAYMMNERNRISNINNITDNLLNSMIETRDEFSRQRSMINNVTDRMFNNLSMVPGLNVLLSKINTRRKRDSLIIALLITTCIILLFFLS